MSNVLAVIEHSNGTPTTLSLQLLTMARRLAEEMDARLEALALGSRGRETASVISTCGVSFLHVADDERLDAFAPAAWAHTVAQLVEQARPAAVLGAGSERGTEVMARVAARLSLPLAANCTEVAISLPPSPSPSRGEGRGGGATENSPSPLRGEGRGGGATENSPSPSRGEGRGGGAAENLLVTRQRWGGSLLEEARLKGEIKLLTVAAHAVAPEPAATPTQITVEARRPSLDEKDFRVTLQPQAEADTGKVSLAQARVVIGGGRGVGSAEGFAALEELAALLGGTVGCSRVVTSLGWRPHSDQVGQTGTRIAPDLYIACGISGAIQHMVGCRAAKHILAINTDRDAPIVAQADYAVIGDVKAVIGAVVAELRKLERD